MIIRKLRLKRGWSQEQFAEMSGLSVRTIQRSERGQSISVESLKALAAVFEIDVTKLTEDADMTNSTDEISTEEKKGNATSQGNKRVLYALNSVFRNRIGVGICKLYD